MAQAGREAETAGTAGSAAALPAGLAALIAEAGQTAKPRPVERWNPPYCGEIDMRIAADGTWFYGGTPVGREALMRLFASILRREPDGSFVLVTPVEKVGIRVEDAPFLAVEMTAEGEGDSTVLRFRTTVGDVAAAGPDNPLRFEIESGTGGLKCYLRVRGGLDALVSRMLMHDVVAVATPDRDLPRPDRHDHPRSGRHDLDRLGVWSGGIFFPFPEMPVA